MILLNADTMMKFASFETVVEMIYKYAIPAPKSECSKNLQLGVSFAGGYIAGVFCAIVSHPADNLVSFLNNAQGATVGDVGFQDIIFCSECMLSWIFNLPI
jgi:solute carrier family 25 phosphate transporter 3